jgi:TPP-dependent pyruvate/acetoin dehydrogenase alpha subunit
VRNHRIESATPDLDLIKQAEQGARDRRGRFANSRSGNPADGRRITPMQSPSPNLPHDAQRETLRRTLTIRHFEESASADYLVGKICGVVHCYIGEEAVAVGVCTALKRGDRIISTHRGHDHCIAKAQGGATPAWPSKAVVAVSPDRSRATLIG